MKTNTLDISKLESIGFNPLERLGLERLASKINKEEAEEKNATISTFEELIEEKISSRNEALEYLTQKFLAQHNEIFTDLEKEEIKNRLLGDDGFYESTYESLLLPF